MTDQEVPRNSGEQSSHPPVHLLQFALDSFTEREPLSDALHSISGVGIAVCDDQFRFKALNKEMAAINGFPQVAHLGRTIREILGAAADLIEPKFELVRTTGQPADLEFEAQLPGRPQAGHWVVRYLPVRSDGAVFRVAAVVMEVTKTMSPASIQVPGPEAIRVGESNLPTVALVGTSPSMQTVYRLIAKAVNHDFPVIILGESGTGKELVARIIHNSGPRKNAPFVPVDCGAITPTLFESELFGYVRGAFTGAAQDRQGLFQAAHTGTLFLDEIGDLPKELQAKLLRTIQEEEVRPVGSTQMQPVDVRIIAATNRDLKEAVIKGDFREDLYYRLNVFQITLPPLRERKVDILHLVKAFLEKHADPHRPITEVSNHFWKTVMQYHWPGNVRELEHFVKRCIVLGSGPTLQDEDPSTITKRTGENLIEYGAVQPLDVVEKSTILKALREAGGNKRDAARMLGIGTTTLYRKLRQYRTE